MGQEEAYDEKSIYRPFLSHFFIDQYLALSFFGTMKIIGR
jgi:hypothetical protein